MAQKADIHEVLLMLDAETHHVKKCPPPHGSAFNHSMATEKATAMRQYRDSSSKTTLAKVPNYFVYLDVGRWAGYSYSFGLICGRNVWLCEFAHKTRHRSAPKAAWWPSKATAPDPLLDFERSFRNSEPLHDSLYVIENLSLHFHA